MAAIFTFLRLGVNKGTAVFLIHFQNLTDLGRNLLLAVDAFGRRHGGGPGVAHPY
jgi:hypothetical protein